MITNYETTNVLNAQIMGLSTDTKPTTGVQPNSLFWELDTNGMYFFDGTQWQPIGGSGGGGGGGGSMPIYKLYNESAKTIASGRLASLLLTRNEYGKSYSTDADYVSMVVGGFGFNNSSNAQALKILSISSTADTYDGVSITMQVFNTSESSVTVDAAGVWAECISPLAELVENE